jgi:cardiolipin synthase A/B
MSDLLRTVVGDLQLLSILIGVNYVLAAACALREIKVSRTSQGSVAWLLSLLLLPFPTALIYLVFGWKFFDDYESERHPGREGRAERLQELRPVHDRATAEWPVLVGVAGMPFLAGNRTDLLIDGEATFTSIFEGIARARTYLLVQFYTIRDDPLGRLLADAMIERARAGVDVYLLYDDIGSSRMTGAYRRRLRDAGVKVAAFNQRHRLLRFVGPLRINYRNHRKIVVVDGAVVWTGGHNVAVDYLGQHEVLGPWRDTHLRVEGPAALACALLFKEDWQWATGELLAVQPTDPVEQVGDSPVLVMGTGPADRIESCAIAFCDTIAQARERLWIVSPYFVPDVDTRTALNAAVLRGVDVRLMLPERADHLVVWLASNAYADVMVERGVSVYRYHAGFLHQKVVLVDDRIASVGSVNFDNRSFSINFEITIWMTQPQAIEAIESMLLADFEGCRQVSAEEVAQRPLPPRFVAHAARLLSPVL